MPPARRITGAANLIFLFIVISGFYLWLPRVWTWIQFKNVLWFRIGLAPKARDFNWHNVIGVWTAVPLAIVVAGRAADLVSVGEQSRVSHRGRHAARACLGACALATITRSVTYVSGGVDAAWIAAQSADPLVAHHDDAAGVVDERAGRDRG